MLTCMSMRLARWQVYIEHFGATVANRKNAVVLISATDGASVVRNRTQSLVASITSGLATSAQASFYYPCDTYYEFYDNPAVQAVVAAQLLSNNSQYMIMALHYASDISGQQTNQVVQVRKKCTFENVCWIKH